jgi:hypothetical protein
MAKTNTATKIPRVPIQTPMFDGPDFEKNAGFLNRTWIIFFERVFGGKSETNTTGSPFDRIRTLDLKDTTVGDDIADAVVIFSQGSVKRVTGVLRKPITADLVVRLNLWIDGVESEVGTFTIPLSQGIHRPMAFDVDPIEFLDLSALTWDVVASDGSIDAGGIASFTVEWE